MIRKKWRDGEVVLSIETEDEFGKALATGEAVELTRELADQLGMMQEAAAVQWATLSVAPSKGLQQILPYYPYNLSRFHLFLDTPSSDNDRNCNCAQVHCCK